jgi:GTP cyclohydrolase I
MAPPDRDAMVAEAAMKISELFDILEIDHKNDHNTRETPQRVAKMLVRDVLRGRYCEPPLITSFDNATGYDELIVTGPISVISTCAHHLMPIYGQAFIGIIPNAEGKLVGLSKYDRIVDHFAGRLQIQEELVKQIGEHLIELTAARGIAVRISAVHMCKTHRGVLASRNSRMVTTACFGELQGEAVKKQFLTECAALEMGLRCD